MSTIKARKSEASRPSGGRVLSRIYSEAEYILNIPNTYKHIRPSWSPYVPTKYGIKDGDRFRIGNVWAYVIMSGLGCLVNLVLSSIVVWYKPARSMLFTLEFYIGVALSFLLAGTYLTTRRRLRRFLLRTSRDSEGGEQRFIYAEVIMILVMGIILLGFQLAWQLPFAMFVFYFLFFNSAYVFTVMLVYLKMRVRTKDYSSSLL